MENNQRGVIWSFFAVFCVLDRLENVAKNSLVFKCYEGMELIFSARLYGSGVKYSGATGGAEVSNIRSAQILLWISDTLAL